MPKKKKDEAEPAHADFGGSTAARWLACSVAQKLQRAEGARPDSPTIGAMEGTAAHKMAELSGLKKDPAQFVGLDVEIKSDMGKRTAETTAHMVPHVRTWQKTLRAYIAAKMPGAKVYAEQWLDMSWLAKGQSVGGTADLIAYDENTGRLLVADFKYGVGYLVDADQNTQGAFYIVGAIQWLKSQGFRVRRATFCVVQPRGSDPEKRITWWFIKDALTFYAEWSALFRAAIDRSLKSDVKNPKHATTGPHCGFCRALPICPAYNQAKGRELAAVFDAAPGAKAGALAAQPPDPLALTPAQLSRIVEVAPLVQRWLKACLALASDKLRLGQKVPGLKLVEGRRVRKWDIGKTSKIAAAISAAGGDPWVLVGITEGAKHLDAVQMDKYTTRPHGKPVVALESDPRPAIADLSAAFDSTEDDDEDPC